MRGLALLPFLAFANIAVSEDIETLKHQIYKDAQITRTEPDGIVITYSDGIVKIPFTELSPDYQKRFGYDAQKATAFSQDQARTQQRIYDNGEAAKARVANDNGQLLKDAEELRKVREQAEAAGRELAQLRAKNARLRADAINRREVIIGMSADECERSWGKPDHINYTTTQAGTREQWCYKGDRYLYLDNGVLKTVQE